MESDCRRSIFHGGEFKVRHDQSFNQTHAKQLLTYLRLLKQPVGLLLNFSGVTMKDGIRRVVNDYRPN